MLRFEYVLRPVWPQFLSFILLCLLTSSAGNGAVLDSVDVVPNIFSFAAIISCPASTLIKGQKRRHPISNITTLSEKNELVVVGAFQLIASGAEGCHQFAVPRRVRESAPFRP